MQKKKKKKNRCWYNYGSYIKIFKHQQQEAMENENKSPLLRGNN